MHRSEELLVVLLREQLLELVRVRQLDLHHPALTIGVRVHETRLALDLLVDLDYFAVNHLVDVGSRLGGLHRRDDIRLGKLRAWLRQLDIDDLAQFALSVISDTHRGHLGVGVQLEPLVRLSELTDYGKVASLLEEQVTLAQRARHLSELGGESQHVKYL